MMKQKQILALAEEARTAAFSALRKASDYLHQYTAEWNEKHETEYQRLVNLSTVEAAKAEILMKVLEG